ncbi:response regulator transcription factor [Variovorax paradoxus]|uniref:response regulator transcription factor n=1 Tax=Variovorax paradoxus TaxID=34073 RepID=UPI0027870227|nr:response regulator transcription factor [Variovorax paradoxus]MDP9932626.1 DNA-binding response OmpR family regulator [Variovorax paradoxus]
MRIAVLEDEPAQMNHLVDMLENRLFNNLDEPVSCVPFHSGEALRSALRTESFDLLVLDWNVPDLDGLQLLAWLRRQRESTIPVVMLSARNSERDAVCALDAGADDYIVKPFRPLELAARIRRLVAPAQSTGKGTQERFGDWVFDRSVSSVQFHVVAGERARWVSLSNSEFHMALALFRNLGRAVSRAHLLERVGRDSEPSNRALDSQIYRLRTKLRLNVENGLRLHTVYGQGYRLELCVHEGRAAVPQALEVAIDLATAA